MTDDTLKIYLEVKPDRVAEIDEIVKVCRLDSRASVFGVAVDLLHEAIKAVLDGKEIHFVGPNSSERIRLPALDHAKPHEPAPVRAGFHIVHDRPMKIVAPDREARPNLRILDGGREEGRSSPDDGTLPKPSLE